MPTLLVQIVQHVQDFMAYYVKLNQPLCYPVAFC